MFVGFNQSQVYFILYDLSCLYYTYWDFFSPTNITFFGAPSVQRRQVMSGAAQVEQQHKDWNSDDEDMAIGSDAMKP